MTGLSFEWLEFGENRAKVICAAYKETSEGTVELTKEEYVRLNPRSTDHCWCCGGDWDVCSCGFYETDHVSKDTCGKCVRHCLCLTFDGRLAHLLLAVAKGQVTEEYAQEQIREALAGQHIAAPAEGA